VSIENTTHRENVFLAMFFRKIMSERNSLDNIKTILANDQNLSKIEKTKLSTAAVSGAMTIKTFLGLIPVLTGAKKIKFSIEIFGKDGTPDSEHSSTLEFIIKSTKNKNKK
jgi:hypothetical protein